MSPFFFFSSKISLMKCKFGALATGGSGSLSGQTLQNSRGGYQLRTKPVNKKQPSNSQRTIRTYNSIMHAGWKSLSDIERFRWMSYASENPVYNRKGEKHTLSGQSLWFKYQYSRMVLQIPFLSDPSKHALDPLGPELIANGDFSSSAGWFINPSSSIHDGYLDAQYGASEFNFCYTSCAWGPAGSTFRVAILTWDVLLMVSFGVGVGYWQPLINGNNVYIHSPVSNGAALYFNITLPGVAARIDNISVKKILT